MLSLRSRHRRGLIDATVRVVSRDAAGVQTATGTGFLIAPGRVVTCAHVLPDDPGGHHLVEYDGAVVEARVLVREPADAATLLYSYPDVALLEVPLTDHECVPVNGPAAADDADLYSYGCPVGDDGPFWEHITMTGEGERIVAGHRFLKAKGGQVRHGASGSGVVDLATGVLAGMLKLTRDASLDLGGVMVPTDVVMATLAAAGHDLAEANRAATEDVDGLAGARRRLCWVLQELENELAMVTPVHRRSMLMEVAAVLGEIPDTVGEIETALALLDLDLDLLGDALSGLARACHSADAPHRLLGGAAAFAWIADRRPLVEPQAAALLAAERRSDRPRVVHVPVAGERSLRLHAARAAVDQRWDLTMLSVVEGETDEETGLPASLVHAIRVELLRAAGMFPRTPEQVRAQWADPNRMARVRARARGRLLVLPAGVADTAALDALRRLFAPCVFAVAGRALPAVLREDATRVLVLPESLREHEEADAEGRYDDIVYRIDEQAAV